jgi:hypothetical protein
METRSCTCLLRQVRGRRCLRRGQTRGQTPPPAPPTQEDYARRLRARAPRLPAHRTRRFPLGWQGIGISRRLQLPSGHRGRRRPSAARAAGRAPELGGAGAGITRVHSPAARAAREGGGQSGGRVRLTNWEGGSRPSCDAAPDSGWGLGRAGARRQRGSRPPRTRHGRARVRGVRPSCAQHARAGGGRWFGRAGRIHAGRSAARRGGETGVVGGSDTGGGHGPLAVQVGATDRWWYRWRRPPGLQGPRRGDSVLGRGRARGAARSRRAPHMGGRLT